MSSVYSSVSYILTVLTFLQLLKAINGEGALNSSIDCRMSAGIVREAYPGHKAQQVQIWHLSLTSHWKCLNCSSSIAACRTDDTCRLQGTDDAECTISSLLSSATCRRSSTSACGSHLASTKTSPMNADDMWVPAASMLSMSKEWEVIMGWWQILKACWVYSRSIASFPGPPQR